MYRFVVAVLGLAPALTLAERCKLGTINEKSAASDDRIKSSQAFEFLKNCEYKFVEKFVEENYYSSSHMNPILRTLHMHSPMDWEVLSEGTVMNDLNSEETKEDLESCISSCNRLDELADMVDNSYEELLEDFVQCV